MTEPPTKSKLQEAMRLMLEKHGPEKGVALMKQYLNKHVAADPMNPANAELLSMMDEWSRILGSARD